MASITQIASVLSAKFVNTSEFAEAISLSLISGIPIIFHGKGGYGKTEMTLEIFRLLNSNWGMLECSPETTSSDIFGGAVAKTTKQGNTEITQASYNLNNSLIKHECFFLEEMLDASFNALAVLKSLITLKGANVDGQFVESKCKVLVGATNINPTDLFESLGDVQKNSYEALLQRFLIVQHEWQDHSQQDYFDLLTFGQSNADSKLTLAEVLEMRKECTNISFSKDIAQILSQLASKSTENGNGVSPRNLMWTKKLMQANSVIRGNDSVDEKDFEVLRYINAFDQSLIGGLAEEIKQQKLVKDAENKLADFSQKIANGRKYWKLAEGNKHNIALTLIREALKLETEFTNSGKYPDSLESQYKLIKGEISDFIKIMKNHASDNTLYVNFTM